MQRTPRRLIAAFLTIITVTLALAPGHALAGGNLGPREMLNTYYSLVNARAYATAYAQWTNPTQTYADFVAGYADTSRVEAHFGGFQPGPTNSVAGRVPGVLIGYRTNGSVAAFSGCYDLVYNPATTGIGQWLITGSNFVQLPTVPAGQAIQPYLATDCYDRWPADFSTYLSVYGMLANYINAVNLADYARAYSLWASPPQAYDQFVSGWADTRETVLFYGAYQWSGTTNAAEAGRVPVVMLGYHTDGSLVAYQGCLGVNYNAQLPRRWSLWSADLRPLPFTTTPDMVIINAALSASCYF